jgi:hypothetical protein
VSVPDHTTAADGQTLAGQDWATQSMFNATWGIWAPVAWVLEHDHLIGQGDPRPAIDVADARNGSLPGGVPCSAGYQCASGVCAAPAYLCSTALVDKSKIDPRLLNAPPSNVTLPTGGTGTVPAGGQAPPVVAPRGGTLTADPWQQFLAWSKRTTILPGSGLQNGAVAAVGAVALLLLNGGHHRRRGGLL